MTEESEPEDDDLDLFWLADPILRECIVKLREVGLTDLQIARMFRTAAKILGTAEL